VISFLPIILIAVLFGLAMDYEVFMVSRIREAYLETNDPSAAVIRGGRQATRIVTAAALIMFSVFASFVGTHDATLKTIAFGLGVGVLVDAFVVRMTLVPAALTLLGHNPGGYHADSTEPSPTSTPKAAGAQPSPSPTAKRSPSATGTQESACMTTVGRLTFAPCTRSQPPAERPRYPRARQPSAGAPVRSSP